MEINADFPEAFDFLTKPSRYKVAYGGRGSGKSWAMARTLLLLGMQRPLRVLCAREIQKSIKDSVHKLLADQVQNLGLSSFYRVTDSEITGANGTEFFFAGLRHNINSIKSIEGCDIVWVEEAQTVSKESWDILDPTIRKPGSEIWVSFNPDLESDATYRRFVVNTPPGAVVKKINFGENPFFTSEMREMAEHCRAVDEDDYNHIWLGFCKSNLKGAIYENELRAVDRESRITRVPYDATRPVQTFWDLGYGDYTAIWFAQVYAYEYRFIDFIQCNQRPLAWYLQQLQAKGYVYGMNWLPWDARPKSFGTGKSIEELVKEAGFKVSVCPQLAVTDGINAARTLFGQCVFDSERCADGLQALRRYRYGESAQMDSEGKPLPTRQPLHDENSHAADAFRTFAVGVRAPVKKAPDILTGLSTGGYGGGGWMA